MEKAKTKKTTKKAPAKKRARTSKGRFVADDPSTPGNEAYETSEWKKYVGIGLAILLVVILIVIN